MPTTYLAPDPIQSMQFIPGGIVPANGGLLFFYAAGTSTKTTVYKDNAGAVAWSNPIVLDSGGNLPSGGEVWFQSGVTYKVVFAPSNDTDPPTSPYWTKDNLQGVNDVSGQISALEWVSGPIPTFISTTSFSVIGDQTASMVAGRRIKTLNTAGTLYGTITSVIFSAGITTVNVAQDNTALDSGLIAVSYGLINPALNSINDVAVNKKANAVASAGNSTTNIWGTAGDYLHVTGTNSIRSFSTAPYAGMQREVVFDGSLTLFTSSAFNITGGNISTAAGDIMTVRADTVSTYTLVNYIKSSGTPYSGNIASSQVFAGPSSTAFGPPSFRPLIGSESAMVLLASTTFTAVSTVIFGTSSAFGAVMDFTAFDEYEFHLVQCRTAVNASLFGTVSENGGATFASTLYYYSWYGMDATATMSTTGAGNQAQWSLGPTFSGSTQYPGVNGKVTLYTLSTTTVNKFGRLELTGLSAAASALAINGGISYQSSTNPVNGFRIQPNTSTFSGSIYAYGIRKA